MMEKKDVERFIDATGYAREDVEGLVITNDRIGLVLFAKDSDGNKLFCAMNDGPVTYVVYVGWDGKKLS